jgi:NADP-dependent 3-hydroxy acid dehydrogenase YdfG
VTAPNMIGLAGKTALITGASSGVGRAIAHEFAGRGAHLLVLGRDPQKVRKAADEISADGNEVQHWSFDLTDDDALQNFIDEIKRTFAGIDYLIHSAGVFKMEPLATAAVSDLDELYRCNVRAPFALTQALLPLVIARSGAIAFINSTAGEKTHAGVGAYAASKHALKALADTLRLEVKPHNVRVLTVLLGRTATPMQEDVCRIEGSVYEPSKFLRPQDVARAVLDALTLPNDAAVENLQLRPTHA